MLIQVSKKRWIAEPEAVYIDREVDGVCGRMVKWENPDSTEVFDVLCEELPEDHKWNGGKIDHYLRQTWCGSPVCRVARLSGSVTQSTTH